MPGWNSTARKVAAHVWQSNSCVSLSRSTELWLADNGYDLASDAVLEGFDCLTDLVVKNIQSKIQECEMRGIKPKYQFSSASTDRVVAQIDTDEHVLRADFRAAIGRLSWRAFEHLCVHVMSATGVAKCKATSATRDQGIDFVGVLELKSLSSSSVWHDVQIRVLGQAKDYRSAVGQEAVRLFKADMNEFSRGEGRAFTAAPIWAKNVYMTQVGFIFALAGFSQDARNWANSHSIMLKDVEQMVQDLLTSDVQTPGLVRHSHQIAFDESNFLTYFEKYF